MSEQILPMALLYALACAAFGILFVGIFKRWRIPLVFLVVAVPFAPFVAAWMLYIDARNRSRRHGD
ncbi:MAG: hypothetical protein HY869_21010 [Chloroflexi bacterium]|nr:hypothetical protein [Chloroflexota bacterium]